MPRGRSDVGARAAKGVRAGKGALERSSVVRGQVDGIQRARVLSAFGEVLAERGVAGTTVGHVVARAGVSRRTFYDLFADREQCFLAAFNEAVERIAARVVPAFAGEGRWHERMRAALVAGLVFLDEEPQLGVLCVVHVLAAGSRALERRAEVVRALVDAVEEGGQEARDGHSPERLVAEGVVGAVLAVLHTRLSTRTRPPLSGLVGPLTGMIVLPYLGAAAAERERRRPVPAGATLKRRPAREDPLKGLDMRLTYRTVCVLSAISDAPGTSNRQIADAAGIADQGQTSKLLRRLRHLGLIENAGSGDARRGDPNAWRLTVRGEQLQHTIRGQ